MKMKFVSLRKKKVLIGGLWGAIIMLLVSSIIAYFWYNSAQEQQIVLKKEYDQKVQKMEKWAGQNNTLYSLKEDVKAGTPIKENMLQEVVVPDNGRPSNVLDKNFMDKDMFARIDLKANTIITNALVYKDEYLQSDVRENQFSFIVLPDKLKKNQFVDVRIQFPDGSDFIVLSKKKAKDLNDVTIWTNMNEGEMLTMSSAIVDAYLQQAKIYAVEYVDDHVQEASTVTYPVKPNVKELMQENPNIVNIAKFHLEKQNRARLEAYLNKMTKEEKEAVRQGEESTRTEARKAKDDEAEKNNNTYDDVFQDSSINSGKGME